MCSQPLSIAQSTATSTSAAGKQVMEEEQSTTTATTPPRPVSRKSSLTVTLSPRSVIETDGTSATSLCSSMNSTVTSTTVTKKTVTFDHIQFQEHAVILGDNPGVQTGGPPVTMDWDVIRRYQMDLNEYETAIGSSRRSAGELRMPATVRQGVLEGHCSMGEMKRAAAAARKIKNQRQFTMAMAESAEGLEVFCASVRRKLKRTFTGSRRRSRLPVDNNSDVGNSQKQNVQQVDPAERWMEQRMPRNSRRATFPPLLVSRNTRRNSMRDVYSQTENDNAESISSASLRTDDDNDDAIIVAAVAHMTVTK